MLTPCHPKKALALSCSTARPPSFPDHPAAPHAQTDMHPAWDGLLCHLPIITPLTSHCAFSLSILCFESLTHQFPPHLLAGTLGSHPALDPLMLLLLWTCPVWAMSLSSSTLSVTSLHHTDDAVDTLMSLSCIMCLSMSLLGPHCTVVMRAVE